MGMGSRKSGRALCLALFVAGLSFAPAPARERNTGIWKVLREGGFSGAMNEDAHVSPFGDMEVGGRHYRLVLFDWFESPRNMKGSSPHGNTRLLVFEILEKKPVYLGNYIYLSLDFSPRDARPRIEGNAVVFPFKKEEGYEPTDRLVFDEKGPPSQVVLDGEICDFFK